MRKWILAAALAGTVATLSSAASAEGYGYCWTRGNGVNLVSPVFAWGDARDFGLKADSYWKYFAWREYRAEVSSRGDCGNHGSESEAQEARSRLLNNIRRPENSKKYRLELVDYVPVSPYGRPATKQAKVEPAPKRPSESAEQVVPQGPQAAELKAQREAEWQAKLDQYEAEKRAWEEKIAARKAEEDRRQAQHAAAQDAAARKIAEHRRQLAEANRRQQEYFAAQRRYALCVGGDQKYCADIAAGKPALGEQLADTGEVSVDTDANRCVTTVETKLNATFKGNTAASVINGCGKPVDVRICLMTADGWNCGVDSAVASQATASHSSFNATGPVFVDARTTGSNRPFNNPR